MATGDVSLRSGCTAGLKIKFRGYPFLSLNNSIVLSEGGKLASHNKEFVLI